MATEVSTDEYEALSLALVSRLKGDTVGPIVIKKQVSRDPFLRSEAAFVSFGVFSAFAELVPHTVSDLLSKEEEAIPAEFDPRFALPCSFHLLTDVEEEKLLPSGGGWKRFYESYPASGGLVMLSRVGFDVDRTQALLHLGWQWEGKAGAGFLVYLQREGGVLRVAGGKQTWGS